MIKRYGQAYLRIPSQAGRVEFFDVALQHREDTHVGSDPFYMLSAPIYHNVLLSMMTESEQESALTLVFP